MKLDKAKALIALGQLQEAERELATVSGQDADQLRVEMLSAQGDRRAAIRLFQDRLIDSLNPLLHFNISREYRELGEVKNAVICVKRAVTLDPSLAEARYNLALYLLLDGDYRGSISQLKEGLRLKAPSKPLLESYLPLLERTVPDKHIFEVVKELANHIEGSQENYTQTLIQRLVSRVEINRRGSRNVISKNNFQTTSFAQLCAASQARAAAIDSLAGLPSEYY